MIEQQIKQPITYHECHKGGYHLGEIMNLVCTDPKCIENKQSVLCSICYSESHRTHKIKPLKSVILSSQSHILKLKQRQADKAKLQDLIKQSKQKMILKVQDFQKYLTTSIDSIKVSINAVCQKMVTQIDQKIERNSQLYATVSQLKTQQVQHEKFMDLMLRLLKQIPVDPLINEQMSPQQVEKSLQGIQKKMNQDLDKKIDQIKKYIQSYSVKLKLLSENPPLFDSKIEFKFSQQMHHQGIQVVSETIIKSIQTYNYHFALMEPSIQEMGNKAINVAFKIKENNSNWLAVGICHKNTIQSNNYQFNYSTLGHGAYMISANAGSWSSIDATKNNVVSSFNFYKDDIIIVSYNPDQGNVFFKKKGTEESYTIQFQNKNNDELCLCCLFYYSNDQIEFLGHEGDLI